jgi:hypothetical protein
VSFNKEDMARLMEDINDDITHRCVVGKCKSTHTISVHSIQKAIQHLKKGKSDGHTAQCTDHIINGSNKLHVYLSFLLSSMLTHGFSPNGFLLSTVIPIPKSKRKSLNDSENYRGIALSSVIGKVYDWVILDTYGDCLNTSDLQFGFKAGHSTAACSFVVKETIQYYLNKNSSVNVVLLDASKAFDKVNYVKLFRLLLRKGICPLVARFLIVLYTDQVLRVRWGDFTSQYFSVSNGVKQGGVLSPILFGIYFDELINKLRAEGTGCYIGDQFLGALAYADDIILLAPTRLGLRKMLDVSNKFSLEYDVTFNPGKCKFMVYDRGGVNKGYIVFNGKRLDASPSEVHLGNIIGPELNNADIKQAVSELYGRTNVTLSLFKHASSRVRYNLFKSFCMSLHGSQLWDYSSKYTEHFFTAWRKCVRQIWRLHVRTHNALLPIICNDLPVDMQLHKRLLKFLWKAIPSSNTCINLCAKLALNGSGSAVGNSLNYMSYKYKFSKYNVFNVPLSVLLKRVHVYHNPNESCESETIVELIDMRDNPHEYDLPLVQNEITMLLEHLCTN